MPSWLSQFSIHVICTYPQVASLPSSKHPICAPKPGLLWIFVFPAEQHTSTCRPGFTWRSAAYGELQLRSHYLCAEEAGRAEDAAAEAEVLAVEQGLMGEGISLRLSRRPLDYVTWR